MRKVFDQINAVNLTEQVEPHARTLESAANAMEAAGIGAHLTDGYGVHLRKMAACMRADAAQGKLPSVYHGQLHAAAEPAKLHPSTVSIFEQLGV
jgi:hypothetical protein